MNVRKNAVTRVEFLDPQDTGPVPNPTETDPRSTEGTIKRWFHTFFTRGTVSFTPLLGPDGTDFQRTIWTVLRTIPAGETRTYGEVAAAAGNRRAARAVGQACARNPIPVLIPCHRVVPAGQGIGNYSGPADVKATLLTHEESTAGGSPSCRRN